MGLRSVFVVPYAARGAPVSALHPRWLDPSWWVRAAPGVYTQQRGFGRITREDGRWFVYIGQRVQEYTHRTLEDAKNEAYRLTEYLERKR